MTKQQTYDYLTAHGVDYETTEHQAVFNMQQLDAVELPYPDRDAKNLFVRDDKKKNFYLITVKGDKRVNLKDFRRAHGLRPLTFASPDDLAEIMRLTPGSVTPLGLLCDEARAVRFYLDRDFDDGGLIGVHPNDNTATVWLKTRELVRILKERGIEVEAVEI